MTTLVVLFFSLLTILASRGEGIQKKDMIEITVTGISISEKFLLDNAYQVSNEGTCLLWKIGKVKAIGKSCREFAEELIAIYRKQESCSTATFRVKHAPLSCGYPSL